MKLREKKIELLKGKIEKKIQLKKNTKKINLVNSDQPTKLVT